MKRKIFRQFKVPFARLGQRTHCQNYLVWLQPRTTQSVYGSLIKPTNSESDISDGVHRKIIPLQIGNESTGILPKIFNSLASPVLRCSEQMPVPPSGSWKNFFIKKITHSPPSDVWPLLASPLNRFFAGRSPIRMRAS